MLLVKVVFNILLFMLLLTQAILGQLATSLASLPAGQRAVVHAVRGEVSIRRRLLEMGLCVGVRVDLIRRAPLRGPIELRVRGYLLSLREEHAALVQVTPEIAP